MREKKRERRRSTEREILARGQKIARARLHPAKVNSVRGELWSRSWNVTVCALHRPKKRSSSLLSLKRIFLRLRQFPSDLRHHFCSGSRSIISRTKENFSLLSLRTRPQSVDRYRTDRSSSRGMRSFPFPRDLRDLVRVEKSRSTEKSTPGEIGSATTHTDSPEGAESGMR